MIRTENSCVGCPPEKGCLGKNCPHYESRRVYYCDHCGESSDDTVLYHFKKEHLCAYCLLENFEEVIAD